MQGSELRAARKKLGLTQGQLADELGISLGFVGEMERGEKPVSRRTEVSIDLIAQRNHDVAAIQAVERDAGGSVPALIEAAVDRVDKFNKILRAERRERYEAAREDARFTLAAIEEGWRFTGARGNERMQDQTDALKKNTLDQIALYDELIAALDQP